MKKMHLVCSAMALLATMTATAQKNTWVVDAGAGISHQNISSTTPAPDLSLNAGSVNVAIGRQLSNHFAIGILGGYGSQQQIEGNYYGNNFRSFKETLNTWNVGIYGRYTYWINKHLFIYSQLSATQHNYSINSTEIGSNYPVAYQPYLTSATQPEGINVNLMPAVGVNLIKGYGIHMDVGGLNYMHSEAGVSPLNIVNLNIGQSFHFGLHKIIGWKKMNNQQDDPNAMLK